MAFALATSLAGETRSPVGRALLYGLAGFTAVCRINDDKHWLSDTVVGATLGIMSTRLVQGWHRRFIVAPGLAALQFSF